jgi:hypothetical protein
MSSVRRFDSSGDCAVRSAARMTRSAKRLIRSHVPSVLALCRRTSGVAYEVAREPGAKLQRLLPHVPITCLMMANSPM